MDSNTPDPFDLERFVVAQRGVHEIALAEIAAGHKRTHWMWFVFPQRDGLGSSAMARRYAIRGLDEARAYLAHPVLGPRLVVCAQAALRHAVPAPERVFGQVDAKKLHSCATLFAQVAPPGSVFHRLLDACWGGRPDAATLARP
jgi:uncharacterized protein (DUF1810 family)